MDVKQKIQHLAEELARRRAEHSHQAARLEPGRATNALVRTELIRLLDWIEEQLKLLAGEI